MQLNLLNDHCILIHVAFLGAIANWTRSAVAVPPLPGKCKGSKIEKYTSKVFQMNARKYPNLKKKKGPSISKSTNEKVKIFTNECGNKSYELA